ncbi:protein split ends-like isoform X2 [Eriocheir sinensis]|uniref:protein split ends-like isoform X2 n=1 Tax=Eriocheir sinensis TaxID=95602 RepID=UPI0021C686F8|nr:protein split ends-like isoform X2 [Eriocheir sinensis]
MPLVRRHLPAALGVTTPAEQILGEYGSAEINVLAMKGIMSLKKTHEVDTMAQVIARLAKGLGVGWLVDLGSGRGYLSTSLVLQYGQSVVAIDSSTANTTSALVRNTKLKRWWDNLRRTWVDQAEGRAVKKGKKARRRKTPSNPQQQQRQQQEDREDTHQGDRKDELKQGDREGKNQGGRTENSNQEEREERNQGTREEDRKQEERDGRKQEDREEKDMNQEDRKQGNVDQKYRNEDKEQENGSQIIRKQENMNQGERRQGNTQTQEERQEEKAKQEKQGSTQSQEDRKQERKQEDKGKEDMTPQSKNSSEGQSAHPIGHYIGVTKFITEDTDLLEVVRSAIRSETVMEGGGNRDESGVAKNDSGVGMDDKTQPCASSDTTSIDARHISNTANKTTGIYSPHVTSTTHTNTRKQVNIETSRDHDIFPLTTTHTNTTVTNTNTTPPPGTGNTTDRHNTPYTTSNTNGKPPSPLPPDSPLDLTSMLIVDEASTLGLVGLHTCGNLASSSLRLFVSDPRVAFLCNVGCCYHLLEEEFSRNTYNQQKIQVDDGLSEKVECECVSECRNEVEVLAAIEQENYAFKPSTDDMELKKKINKLTQKDECVSSCENKVEDLEGIKQVNYAFKSSKSHTEQVEKTLLTHKGNSEERRVEETGVFAAVKEENKSLMSSKGHMEQEEKTIRQTHKEEKRLSGYEEEMKVLEIKQENGAIESSIGHLEDDKCRTKSLSPVNKEISAEEHEETERSSALIEDDCSFSKSSTSNTEERERTNITGATLLTSEKEEKRSNKSPLQTSSPLESHSPPDTRERTHKGNRSSPPPSPPLQDHTKEEDDINSPLQKPSSPLSPPTTKTKTCKTNPSPPPSSPPLQNHTVLTKNNINSPQQPPSSSPSSPHTTKTKICKTNPSSPRAQDGGGEGDIDPLHPSLIPNLGHGFPLSSFLRSKRFALGRNSRMLSSQAADRLTQGNIGGADSLYWRALLQVVLVDRLGDVSHLSHVGRLSAKCHTFPEYAQAALARLGVSLEVTEEELQEYDRSHSSSKDRLERFFLLRASLAAVVEGAVLLDRLAFLCEQDNVSAFLVPMFDPVTSPRCHALIAVRRRERSTASDTLTRGKE